jgi:hypothetical protein
MEDCSHGNMKEKEARGRRSSMGGRNERQETRIVIEDIYTEKALINFYLTWLM